MELVKVVETEVLCSDDCEGLPPARWGVVGGFWANGLCRTMAAVVSERPSRMMME